jgi:uncharacterized protein (TIGR02611 family)
MKASTEKLKTLAILITGWLLVAIGLAALVLPGPGLLALFAGLALLATRYEWAERRLEPVKTAALKGAHDSVSSTSRVIFSTLAALTIICVGIYWGQGSNTPSWWPVSEKYWLIGGWGTGGTLIGSGIIALGLLIFSYIRFRPR